MPTSPPPFFFAWNINLLAVQCISNIMITFKKNITFKIIINCATLALLSSCSMMTQMSTMRGYGAASGPVFDSYHGLKRKIAVLEFEDNTNLGAGKAGSAATDMVIGVLTRSGRFLVIERSELEGILKEQELGQSGAITHESAITAGRLAGVQALVLGRLESLEHQYKRKDLDYDNGDWGIAVMGSLGFAELYCEVIDVASGEILFSDQATGTQVRPGFVLRSEEFDIEDEHSLDETVVGVALRKAANKLAERIVEVVDEIPWYGKVIKIEGDKVYFTPGRTGGVQVGTRFQIIPEWLKVGGDGIDDVESIAEIEVIGHIGDRVSTAQVLSGGGIIVGSLVRDVWP